MLKNVDELLELCDDFVNEIDDFEINLNTDFFCFPTTNEIFISVLANANSIQEFRENLYSRTDVHDISEFTWSLLHEVGHCQTWHIMNDRTINRCKHIKRKIERGSIPTTVYYGLTDERIATDWAINFVKENYDEVQAFDVEALTLLTKIFIDNDIDLES
jgi:hypothetical protein